MREAQFAIMLQPRYIRKLLRVGDFAKVVLWSPQRQMTEGLWLEVLGYSRGGYVGRVDNNPIVVKLKYNEKLHFFQSHILKAAVKK